MCCVSAKKRENLQPRKCNTKELRARDKRDIMYFEFKVIIRRYMLVSYLLWLNVYGYIHHIYHDLPQNSLISSVTWIFQNVNFLHRISFREGMVRSAMPLFHSGFIKKDNLKLYYHCVYQNLTSRYTLKNKAFVMKHYCKKWYHKLNAIKQWIYSFLINIFETKMKRLASLFSICCCFLEINIESDYASSYAFQALIYHFFWFCNS